MDRRSFLQRASLIAAGVVAADQLEILDRLGWTRRLFPSAQISTLIRASTEPGARIYGLAAWNPTNGVRHLRLYERGRSAPVLSVPIPPQGSVVIPTCDVALDREVRLDTERGVAWCTRATYPDPFGPKVEFQCDVPRLLRARGAYLSGANGGNP